MTLAPFIQDKTALPAGTYTFRFADPANVPQMSSWELVSKIVTFPFEAAEALYKLFEKTVPSTPDSTLPSRCAEFASKLIASPSEMGREFYRLYLGRAPESGDPSVKWLFTEQPAIGKALLKHPRNDPNGLLITYSPLLNLLKTLYPTEKVEEEDLLFNCKKDCINKYRRPILRLAQPGNIDKHKIAIGNTIEEIVEHLIGKETKCIEAGSFSLTYSTAMVAKLLLGHPGGSKGTYLAIGNSSSRILNGPIEPKEPQKWFESDMSDLNEVSYEVMAERERITTEKNRELAEQIQRDRELSDYKAIQTLSEAVETSLHSSTSPLLGSLLEKLENEENLTELQKRGLILSLYIAGSETTSSLLTMLLWQLAKDEKSQEEIFQEIGGKEGPLLDIGAKSPTINRFFTESIRLFPPVSTLSRETGKTLVCTATDSKGEEVYRRTIPKGTTIVYGLRNAAKSFYSEEEEESSNFNPRRDEPSPDHLPWLPFGDGQHACPGQWLAKTEITALIAHLVQNYTISAITKNPPRIYSRTTTERIEEGVPLRFTPRSK